MKRDSLMISIARQQCPSCRSEKMFTGPVYSKRFYNMHQKCPNCSQELEPEPGFYTGAMYVSYAFQIILIAIFVVASLILGVEGSYWWYVGWIAGLSVVLLPLIYRLSRSVWAHMFIPYRGQTKLKVSKS